MNSREIGEIRRRIRPDRSNITAFFGCYVNDKKEIVSQFCQSRAMMPENEAEKYFALMKRILSGSIGKNLIDIRFQTAQVAGSPEHKLLMDMRRTCLKDEAIRSTFYQKVIESVDLQGPYLVLACCDSYDVPFKGKDGETDADRTEETYTCIMCAICPVKQVNPGLQYKPENKVFHDGGIFNMVAAPELGFLFPAFDDRSSNIYNALYYTHSAKESHSSFADTIFHTSIPKPAAEQKKSFEALLERALDEECSLNVVQSVHDQICQRIALHKESRTPEPLMVTKDEVTEVLASCGVSEPHMAKFRIDYDDFFGFEAQLHPQNIINNRSFEIKTPDVSIKVAPDRTDLIETRIIGGVKYIMICADGDIEVNGVSIHTDEKEAAAV